MIARQLLAAAALMTLCGCGSDDSKPPPTGRDRSLVDESGRTCTWCSDWECDFICDPPNACDAKQRWTFDSADATAGLKVCPVCPGAGPRDFDPADCSPIVCESSADCVLTGYECEDQRCFYR